MTGRDWDDDQERSALSFPVRVGSKRTPNAFIKEPNAQKKCNVPQGTSRNKNACFLLTLAVKLEVNRKRHTV